MPTESQNQDNQQNLVPNPDTSIHFWVQTQLRQKRGVALAEVSASGANRDGQTVPEITAQLCRNGYAASTAEVAASLNAQGVQTVSWEAVSPPPALSWNAQADAFALAGHQLGHTTSKILEDLSRNGFFRY